MQAEHKEAIMTNKVKIQLPISGMACASCVAKAEKTLNQIEG